MKVGVLGPEGTYTHEAASQYFDELEPVFCSTITESLDSETETAIVPIENSLGGGVTETIDELRKRDVEVTGEKVLEINHCLVSREKGIKDIQKVRSHPQALSQCKEFIREFGFEEIEASSTAKAAAELGEGEAAIASETAAHVHDLNVIKKGLQDTKSLTRFLIINGESTEPEKTSIILEPEKDYPGLLSSMLSCLSGHDINLSQIQSRPTREKLGKYFFYIEADAGKEDENFQNALDCLKTYTELQVLGSYRSDNHA
jgi:prephenate dehydratase